MYANVLKQAAYGPYAPYAGYGSPNLPGQGVGIQPVMGTQPGTQIAAPPKPNGTDKPTLSPPLGIVLAGGAAAAAITGAWSGLSAILLREKFSTGFKIGAMSTALAIAVPYVISKMK